MQENFTEQFNKYAQTLNMLEQQCETAERQKLVAETNLKNLEERRTELITECETYAGTSIENVAQLMEEKRTELDAIMAKMPVIPMDRIISDEELKQIQELAEEFGVVVTE